MGGGGGGVCKIKYELLKSKDFVMERYSVQRPKYFFHRVHIVPQGAEESNLTEISVKCPVSMHRHLILLFKVPYVTLVLVMQSCYASNW